MAVHKFTPPVISDAEKKQHREIKNKVHYIVSSINAKLTYYKLSREDYEAITRHFNEACNGVRFRPCLAIHKHGLEELREGVSKAEKVLGHKMVWAHI